MNKMKQLKLFISAGVLSFLFIQKTYAHCEVPCGIYEDSVRIVMIYEHITTIEQSMKKRGRYVQVTVPDKEDRRKKSHRIVDTLKPITSNGQFFINFALHSEFVEQFTAYPAINHDDVIEAVAEATRIAMESLTLEGQWALEEDDDDDEIKLLGSCP